VEGGTNTIKTATKGHGHCLKLYSYSFEKSSREHINFDV
jgi:hypothetical protein